MPSAKKKPLTRINNHSGPRPVLESSSTSTLTHTSGNMNVNNDLVSNAHGGGMGIASLMTLPHPHLQPQHHQQHYQQFSFQNLNHHVAAPGGGGGVVNGNGNGNGMGIGTGVGNGAGMGNWVGMGTGPGVVNGTGQGGGAGSNYLVLVLNDNLADREVYYKVRPTTKLGKLMRFHCQMMGQTLYVFLPLVFSGFLSWGGGGVHLALFCCGRGDMLVEVSDLISVFAPWLWARFLSGAVAWGNGEL